MPEYQFALKPLVGISSEVPWSTLSRTRLLPQRRWIQSTPLMLRKMNDSHIGGDVPPSPRVRRLLYKTRRGTWFSYREQS
jgi:hypothetical protein